MAENTKVDKVNLAESKRESPLGGKKVEKAPKKLSFLEAIKAKDFDTVKEIATKAAKEHFEESTKNMSADMKDLKAHPLTKKLMDKVDEIKKK